MREQDENKQSENMNEQLDGVDGRGVSRRNFFTFGTAAAALLGGAGNLRAATLSNSDDEQLSRPAMFVVPSPKTLATIETVLRDTLRERMGESFEDVKASLKRYQKWLQNKLARADAYVTVGAAFFNSDDGQSVLTSMERVLALVEDAAKQGNPNPDSISSTYGKAGGGLSDCDKAFLIGVGAITAGALIFGIPGAVGAFLGSVAGLAFVCLGG